MLTRSRMISRRHALSIVVALPMVLACFCAATAALGWIRAPGLVAREMAQVRHPLSISDLPRERVEALLRVEDPTFFTHHGLDLSTPGAGMTTITQALVKFLYFDEFRPGWRKLPQSLFALGLDARVAKDDELRLFLNRGYLGTVEGHEVRGFGEAAEAYFGKPAAELTREEWLALVAMCVGPDAFSVARSPERNHERVARIERLLAGNCRPADWLDVYYEECR
jgi:membrane peptidoglycan carboxypeptidase